MLNASMRRTKVHVRRIVTGHSAEGKAVVASDETVPSTFAMGAGGSTATVLWGRDDLAQFPDDGSQPVLSSAFPPPGGCGLAILELAPQDDAFHEFVRDALVPWADPNAPGMHRTATIDYDIVLDGTIGLELDDGVEVTLEPGDVVVQNGTRHRWHNRGRSVARLLSVTIGAHHHIEGGGPV
jgi:mannose-6-phosphate isomerase-like protein (cupin superfamily)